MHQLSIGPLIVQRFPQCGHFSAAFFLNPAAHHIKARLCRNGSDITRQLFAHQQANGRRQRHFIGRLRPADWVRAHPHLKRMVQVGADALHRACPKGFDARILNCVKHCACNGLAGAVGAVETVIMMFQPQRHAIGKAARLSHLLGGQQATRHWHTKILARLARRVCRKGNFHLRLMRNGTRRARQHLLEDIEGRLISHDHPLATIMASGNPSQIPQW